MTASSPYRVIRRDESKGIIFVEDTSVPEGSQFRFLWLTDGAVERLDAARARLKEAVKSYLAARNA